MSTPYYQEILQRLTQSGHLDPQRDQILVIAGGEHDRDCLLAAGFKHVTISNLDSRMKGDEFAPYDWQFYDAEELSVDDERYDVVIVHNGLHHCFVPQKAMAQMLRVARRGILLFEPYDNLVTRIGARLGIGQQYEAAAVYYNGCEFGGVANTAVANFIYRFTRREIIKTAACACPHGPAEHLFFHKLIVPWQQIKGRKNKLILPMVWIALPFLKLLSKVSPTQSNSFAAWIGKPNAQRGWWPWIEENGEGGFRANVPWLEKMYKNASPTNEQAPREPELEGAPVGKR